MHGKDALKLLAAGFTLYRCSDAELLVKCRTAAKPNWHLVSRYKTKAAVIRVRNYLYNDPKAIQD